MKFKNKFTQVLNVCHEFYHENIKTIRPTVFAVNWGTYGQSTFKNDAFAGLSVAILTFPLAMAIGVASGLSVQVGLISAIIGGLLTAVLSGARVQISGPTAALAILTLGIAERFGLSGVFWVMIFAAFLLIIGGVFGLGSVIKFVPQPVLIGFTAGIAVNIIFSQLKDFMGLPIIRLEPDFIKSVEIYAEFWNDMNMRNVWVGSSALAIMFLFQRMLPRVPGGPLLAIIVSSFVVWLFDIPVECLKDRFGNLSFNIDFLHHSEFEWEEIFVAIPQAFSVAFIIAIEGLLTAKVGDMMTGDLHRPNTELIGEGVANGVIALFGGIPSAGSISRTAMCIKGGGTTCVSGVIYAIALLLFSLTLTPLAGYIPFCVLSALLFIIAWNISHAYEFIRVLFSGFEEALLLLLTFILTVVQGLSTGIAVGVIVASILFMKRMSEMVTVRSHSLSTGRRSEADTLPEGVFMYSIEGPFFFGSASRIRSLLDMGKEAFDVYIIHLQHTYIIDSSAIKALELFIREIIKRNNDVIICSEEPNVIHAMQRYLSYNLVPKTHRTKSIHAAIEVAKTLISKHNEKLS